MRFDVLKSPVLKSSIILGFLGFLGHFLGVSRLGVFVFFGVLGCFLLFLCFWGLFLCCGSRFVLCGLGCFGGVLFFWFIITNLLLCAYGLLL